MDWRLILKGAASVAVFSRRTLSQVSSETDAEMRERARRQGISEADALVAVLRERHFGQMLCFLCSVLALGTTVAEGIADCPEWMLWATSFVYPLAWFLPKLAVCLLPSSQQA
jgi:hypothetical protein